MNNFRMIKEKIFCTIFTIFKISSSIQNKSYKEGTIRNKFEKSFVLKIGTFLILIKYGCILLH